jgi:hypothetical protein
MPFDKVSTQANNNSHRKQPLNPQLLHSFSKLRDLPEKNSYFKCQFYVTRTAKNSKRKQTVKRHFKPYLIPK